MRTFIFILLLAVAVTVALLWNRRFTTGLARPPAPADRPAGVEVDRVTVILGTPAGKTAPRRRPPPRTPPKERPPRTQPRVEAPTPQPPTPPPAPVERKAVLRRGETVYRMAVRLFGDGRRYKDILRLNGLSEQEATNLRAGTNLLIPER